MRARTIFVFDTCTQGLHTTPAACQAVALHAAVIGRGCGLQGDAWAVPFHGWRDDQQITLSHNTVRRSISGFVGFALRHGSCTFHVAELGQQAGWSFDEVAHLFRLCGALQAVNILLPVRWLDYLDWTPVRAVPELQHA